MAKVQKTYVCQSCGSASSKWSGKCEGCGEWNSIIEEVSQAAPKGLGTKKKGRRIEFVPLNSGDARTVYPRHVTGINEFDRVLGGGLVPGSAVLIGGDPGIGKSTLLLQAVCALAGGAQDGDSSGAFSRDGSARPACTPLSPPEEHYVKSIEGDATAESTLSSGDDVIPSQPLRYVKSNKGRESFGEKCADNGDEKDKKSPVRCVYVSGEEAVDQVRMRAQRLGLMDAPVELASATNVRDIVASVDPSLPGKGPGSDATRSGEKPVSLLIIDSIQTMFIDSIDSAPGTVTQVRTSAQEIIRMAKARNMAVIFVGHVTKDGQIAGPRVLEHLVDTVLYFEGERSHQFRILRSVKNRFGPTDEIGVFEMAGQGLVEVENPSALFLSQRHGDVAGSAVLAALEGTRPILVEVQALVAPSSLAAPRRAVLGYDSNRLAMIVAVLETRCGLNIGSHDIFLNIAGGVRINEPAADVAVAAALISALSGNPLPAEAVLFGEIGLAGEIRQVARPDLRLKEASKLGFNTGVVPLVKNKKGKPVKGIEVREMAHIQDVADLFASSEPQKIYAA